MLGKEDLVRVVCPTGASLPDITVPEALGQGPASYGPADVFDEPAHEAKCGIEQTSRPTSTRRDRSAA
jgi:hypothetical protein